MIWEAFRFTVIYCCERPFRKFFTFDDIFNFSTFDEGEKEGKKK